ncbi:MAG: hypothetical protein KC912_10290 [Proteobacteria bacterium]|nr:hypothetical protein [Pseudomonadota bacterium]
MTVIRELTRWSWLHAAHLLLAPFLGLTVITFLHELAHSGAALAMGAHVIGFHFLPTSAHLGVMRYRVPAEVRLFSPAAVSLAPYLMWFASAAAVGLISILPNQRLHPAFASTLFFWGYCVPVGDVLANLGRGDLWRPGLEGLALTLTGAVAISAAWIAAFPVQRRLYGERSLSIASFTAASAVLLSGVFTVL